MQWIGHAAFWALFRLFFAAIHDTIAIVLKSRNYCTMMAGTCIAATTAPLSLLLGLSPPKNCKNDLDDQT